jgi:SAM-dependent methyltransferase
VVSGFYDDDLAFVHAAGFADLSIGAGKVVLRLLAERSVASGTIVDLGCGTGEWLCAATTAGYGAVGVDISSSMLMRAAVRAPSAQLIQSTLFDIGFPACVAVTAFGEALCYGTPKLPDLKMARSLFTSVRRSIDPDGVFVFDVVVEGSPAMNYRNWTAGDDWAVLVDVREDVDARELDRDITVFRRVESGYRRSSERHRQRVWDSAQLTSMLEDTAFAVSTRRDYDGLELGQRRLAFVARPSAP